MSSEGGVAGMMYSSIEVSKYQSIKWRRKRTQRIDDRLQIATVEPQIIRAIAIG